MSHAPHSQADITGPRQSFLVGEKRVLEMTASGEPLEATLDALCRLIEEQAAGCLCGILLVDPRRGVLEHCAAPNLPLAYSHGIHGSPASANAGPCGKAAQLNQQVIVAEIATDSHWASARWRDLALAHGLRACWSTPITGSEGRVLGTFAIYWREPFTPTPEHHCLIEQTTHLAAIAIERKRTHDALQESEARFREMAHALPEVNRITALKPEEKVLYVSPGFERIWGIRAEELYEKPRVWTEAIHPEDRDRVRQRFNRWASGEETDYQDVEYRLLTPQGDVRWIHERGVLTRNERGEPMRISGISTDITERKRDIEELRAKTELLDLAQKAARAMAFDWYVQRDINRWSPEQEALYGLPPGAFDGTFKSWKQRVHPEDWPKVVAALDQARKTGEIAAEYRVIWPDGSIHWLAANGQMFLDDAGLPHRMVGFTADVTPRKIAEEKLRQDEQELRRITDAIPHMISVLAPDGAILFANRMLLDYCGLDAQTAHGFEFRERLFHPDDMERVKDVRQTALERAEPFELEMRARRKDGVYRWFLHRYNPLRDDRGTLIRWYATGTDIEDRKQAEERIRNENLALREEIDRTSMFEEIVGSSDSLRDVLRQVTRVAPSETTVLILGETGTGKELVARAIHKRSHRAAQAFIRVNCAAIPAPLIASELFGHEKGAFTGALQRRMGRFESANGGTIFLDEIGELPHETQVALLRVLQEREFERVGGNQSIRTDVRVLAATNRDLKAAVAAGQFRSDLFYRLNVFPVTVPALRERPDDITLLVEYFVERYGKRAGKKIRTIDAVTLDLLRAYDWPGNVRELQNVVERAVVFCDDHSFSVDPSWLKRESPKSSGSAVPLPTTLTNQEKQMIEAALAECHGRIAGPQGAAAKLGMPRQTLESRIKSLGINKFQFKTSSSN